MRIAILGDTHMPRGRRALPSQCLELLTTADLIAHTGDFVAAEVLEELEAIGPPVVAVHGNIDDAELRSRLPETREIDADSAVIGLIHDPGPAKSRLERLRTIFPDAGAVVFGHTHMPQHETREDFQIFNPGSPTERRRAPAHTMGVARVSGDRVEFELVEVG